MKLLTCVGYYATGSGAAKDFCCEFDNCKNFGNYEIRFPQDPCGLSDLEYNIVENNHRHNTSNAIKEFRELMKFYNGCWYTKRYRKFFGDDFLEVTEKYIQELVELESNCWWHYDQYKKGPAFYFMDILYGKFTAKFRKEGRMSLLKNKEKSYYTYMDKEKFYEITKRFTSNLFKDYCEEDLLMVDQLVSPSNVNRYLNYFENLKVIIVDRDPRDLYIAARENYQEGIIPAKNVEEFSKWYEITRKHRKFEKINLEKVLFLNFEDMIYKYDKTAKKIMEFIGLDSKDQSRKFEKFDPKKSIRGTKLIEKFPIYKVDVEYIEKNLKEYLYNYDKEEI